jgi:hypothetical protein
MVGDMERANDEGRMNVEAQMPKCPRAIDSCKDIPVTSS